MSDFDDALLMADADVADTFGDAATLNDGVTDHLVVAVLDKDVQVFKPHGQVSQNHISIPSPPVPLKNGYTVTFADSGEVYTLREEMENDGFMPSWSVTLSAS